MHRTSRLNSIFHSVANFFFPPHCVCCNELLQNPNALCPDCLKKFSIEKKRECAHCLKVIQLCECPPKVSASRGMSRLYKVFSYIPSRDDLVANQLIYSIKNRHLHYTARFLAEELYDTILLHGLNLNGYEITYIPASKKRMVELGYNQSALVAKQLSSMLEIAVSPVLKRTKETKAQKELAGEKRIENTKGLFAVRKNMNLHGRKFVLLDDVCTTGSTLLSAGKALKEAGAAQVIYLSISATAR